MKKARRSTISILFSFFSVCLFLFYFTACENFNKPLKLELKEYTEKVVISSHNFSTTWPADKDGITSVPSSDTFFVSLFMRNPQQYILEPDVLFASGLSPVKGTDFQVTQSEITTLTMQLNSDYLKTIDGGTDINPVFMVKDPKTGRVFESYSFPLRCNSPPEPVINATVLKDNSTVPQKYVLCFNMPDMSGIHKDIVSLDINGQVYPVVPGASTDPGLSDPKFEFIYNDTNWEPVDPADPIEFAGKNLPRAVYYLTDSILSAADTTFVMTLRDSKGFSAETLTSTQSKKLKPPFSNQSPATPVLIDSSGYGTITVYAPLTNQEAEVVYTATSGSTVLSGSGSGSAQIRLPAGYWTISAFARKRGMVDSDLFTASYRVGSIMYYVDGSGGSGDDTNTGGRNDPYKTVKKAVETIAASGKTSGSIILLGNVNLNTEAPPAGDNMIEMPDGFTISIESEPAAALFEINALDTRRVMNIPQNAHVTLKNVKLTGGDFAGDGGGVYVAGTLTIDGAEITGNAASGHGGGVYVSTGGRLAMSAGVISDNSAANSGGGIYTAGTFTATGGSILNNSASNDGGGMYVTTTTINLQGLVIGSVADPNTASASGGGICIYRSAATITNLIIEGNRANATRAPQGGGGIYALECSGGITIQGSTIIRENTAPNANGGALMLAGSGSGGAAGGTTLTIKTGVEIKENSAKTFGGGVYVPGQCTFVMEGGTIMANDAEGGGGGVYVADTFKLSGSSVISGNTMSGSVNNVYLPANKKIIITGSLTAGTNKADIGITTETLPPYVFTSGYAANNSAVNPSVYFKPDTTGYAVDSDGTEARLVSNIRSEVYLSGSGDDTNDGSSTTKAVATFDKAKELLATGGTIWVSGTVKPNSTRPQTFTLAGKGNARVKRAAEFTGALFELPDTTRTQLTLQDIIIDGNSSSATSPLVKVGTTTTLTLENGAILENNTSSSAGGAIEATQATVIMKAGSIIRNNTASSGGGINLLTNAVLNMNGGEISNNRTSSANGGGVHQENSGAVFNMSGGFIKDNKAVRDGGGVSVGASSGTCTVSGSAVIQNNTNTSGITSNVYLATGKTITINGRFNSDAKIGVTATNSKPYTFTSGYTNSEAPGTYFTSDDNSLSVDINGGEAQLKQFFGYYVKSDGNDSNTGKTTTAPLKTIQEAVNRINIDNQSNRVPYTIYVMDTITGTGPTGNSAMINITPTATLTLSIKGFNGQRTIDAATLSRVMYMNSDSTVTIENLKLTRGKITTEYGGGVYVNGGNLTLASGAVIEGNDSGNRGGGIGVMNSTGRLTIQNGAIIRKNNAEYGGAIYLQDSAKCTMTGGTIGGGTASETNTATYGGGIAMFGGTFRMDNGTLSNNTASSSGGGVYINGQGTFELTGGTISNNTATSTGGGVSLARASSGRLSFIMANGTVSNNTATNGAGIYISGSSSTGTGDCIAALAGGTIKNNTASYWGGGIYIDDSYTNVTMNGTTIGGSAAQKNSAQYGGGVYMDKGTFTMSGGTISYNEATNPNGGGGISLQTDSTFKLQGNSIITNNTGGNVYLPSNKVISVTGAITSGANIGVTMQTTTGGTPVAVRDSSFSGTIDASKFSRDDSGTAFVFDTITNRLIIPYTVGDIGPAGGWIFYDKGSYSDNWRYLEAASSAIGPYFWNTTAFIVTTYNDATIDGKTATDNIIAELDYKFPSATYAAKACREYRITYSGTVYNDWFLPSITELGQIYTSIRNKFALNIYWSATNAEVDGNYWAKAVDFASGLGSNPNVKPEYRKNMTGDQLYVIPVRRF